MNQCQPFHLALPVTSLEQSRHFYGELLGCTEGRSSARWVDFNFWGHQLVVHLVSPEQMSSVATNPVDGEAVPAAHFGPVLPWADFMPLVDRLRERGVEFVIAPTARFAGRRGEQMTLFVKDPSGNHLEFKSFRNIEMLFARDGLDYP